MRALKDLQLVGRTNNAKHTDRQDRWLCISGGIWGPAELTEIDRGNISSSLCRWQLGELTFNRIKYGNHFSTFDIQIPISRLEHRLGGCLDTMVLKIRPSDTTHHILQHLIGELMFNTHKLDDGMVGFLTNQLLDTVAFFLSSGNDVSGETQAVRMVRARLLAYLDANFRDESLNPLEIAKGCGISRSYLYKVFSDGPSVMEHIRRRRLEAAREMIGQRREKLTMTMVAMSCGFSNPSEFSRLFKKEFGVAPSQF